MCPFEWIWGFDPNKDIKGTVSTEKTFFRTAF